uniref:Meiosis-specific protein MEI4 n=1 Tax=Phascolarctos cinereus TaxID=38626 RepID=A0A6P5LCX2_PHACI|nr:meiosis-specific protein MEI4 [Phascolarctos cinereus]
MSLYSIQRFIEPCSITYLTNLDLRDMRAPFTCCIRERIKDRMEVQTWYLKTSKLAVALAIIRSKPPDRNSREYTEHLAKMLSGQDGEWRSKVEALETEVLQLRQKLLLSQICPRPYVKNGNTAVPPSSKEPKSPENISSQLEDSGCDVLSENRTDPSELSQNVEESFTSSSEISVCQLPIVKSHCAFQEKTLSSHLQFLQHVLELKNLTQSGNLKTDLNKFESDCSTVSDSVFRLLDGLISFYSDSKLPFSNFLTEAVSILTRLIDDCNLSNHILKKCFKKLEEFEKTLVQVILRNSSINRFQVQHYISNSLVILGKCSFLRKPVISLLLSQVNNFTDELRNMHQLFNPITTCGLKALEAATAIDAADLVILKAHSCFAGSGFVLVLPVLDSTPLSSRLSSGIAGSEEIQSLVALWA